MLDNKSMTFSPKHQPSDSSSFASLTEGKGQLQVPRPDSSTAPYGGWGSVWDWAEELPGEGEELESKDAEDPARR